MAISTALKRRIFVVAFLALSVSACDLEDLVNSGVVPAPPAEQPEPAAPAPVPAPPEQPPPPAPEPEPAPAPAPAPGLSAEQQQMLDLVNAARAEEGLDPYVANATLMASATEWSRVQAERNTLFHSDLGFIDCNGRGENVAAGQRSVEEVFQGWMTSPGHRANILRDGFTDFGFGFASAAGGVTYWTQQFAAC